MKIKRTKPTGRSVSDREWIYGLNPVNEALKAGRAIQCIFLSSARHSKTEDLKKMAEERKIPVKTIEPIFFDTKFRKGHQGVAAQVSHKGYMLLEELIEIPSRKKEVPSFFILDCIEDPRNLGAILRTADAAGVHGVIIQSYRSATLSPEVSKVSAGAVEYVPVAIVPNIKHAIIKMKGMGIYIVGTEANAEKMIWEIDLKVPLAIVLGSEGKGLRRTVNQKCDVLTKLPMQGRINSLNVSVAAGIFAFEILRQRLKKN